MRAQVPRAADGVEGTHEDGAAVLPTGERLAAPSRPLPVIAGKHFGVFREHEILSYLIWLM